MCHFLQLAPTNKYLNTYQKNLMLWKMPQNKELTIKNLSKVNSVIAVNIDRHIKNRKHLNLLSANPTKWSNTFKQFVSKFQRIVWVFDHFAGLALKELSNSK